MPDAVAIAAIGAIGSFMAALLGVINTYLVHKAADHIVAVKEDVALVKENVITIEKATNSMKDALVAVTSKEAYARGVAAAQNVEKLKVADDIIQKDKKDVPNV